MQDGGSLPAIASLNSSYSTSLTLPTPYLLLPPVARKAVSDVRRTFCLFVTFDLLFITLLWIIELNVNACLFIHRFKIQNFNSIDFSNRLDSSLVVLQVTGPILDNLADQVIRYKFKSSFFDIVVSAQSLLLWCESKFYDLDSIWGAWMYISFSRKHLQSLALGDIICFPFSSSSCQLLALFRFLCLQIGYAAFRLKHWWVVAVSQLRHSKTHLFKWKSPNFSAEHE